MSSDEGSWKSLLFGIDTKSRHSHRYSMDNSNTDSEKRRRWFEQALANASKLESELDNLEYGHWDYFWRRYKEFWNHAQRISRMFGTLRPLLRKDRDRLWNRYRNICRETKKTQRNEWELRQSDSQIKMGVIELILKDARYYSESAKNGEDLKKVRTLLQEALDKLRVNNLLREDRKHCWKLWRETNSAVQNRRLHLLETNHQQLASQIAEMSQAATSGNPYAALSKIKEIQKTMFQIDLNRAQREAARQDCQKAWDEAIARVEERRREKEQRSQEVHQRMEEKVGYWHGLIQKNEDAISNLEKQIDTLEERTTRGKPHELVDEHAWRIEEKYGKIKDMRELNRRLEERIQDIWQKRDQVVEKG